MTVGCTSLPFVIGGIMKLIRKIRTKLGLCNHDYKGQYIFLDRMYTWEKCTKCNKLRKLK